jgi:hypothetical protein
LNGTKCFLNRCKCSLKGTKCSLNGTKCSLKGFGFVLESFQAVQVAPMGRYNLTVVGRKRFKVLHLWQDEESFGLWRATIDAFEDEPQDEVHEQESAGRGLINNSNNITTGADPRSAGAGSGEEGAYCASATVAACLHEWSNVRHP